MIIIYRRKVQQLSSRVFLYKILYNITFLFRFYHSSITLSISFPFWCVFFFCIIITRTKPKKIKIITFKYRNKLRFNLVLIWVIILFWSPFFRWLLDVLSWPLLFLVLNLVSFYLLFCEKVVHFCKAFWKSILSILLNVESEKKPESKMILSKKDLFRLISLIRRSLK